MESVANGQMALRAVGCYDRHMTRAHRRSLRITWRLKLLAWLAVVSGSLLWGTQYTTLAGESNDSSSATIAPAQRLAIQSQLRAPQIAVRLEAIQRLTRSPGLDAARVLVEFALRDAEPEVQAAAYRALHGLGTLAEVRELCQLRLLRESQAAHPTPLAPQLLRFLLDSNSTEISASTRDWLERKFAPTRHSALIVLTLADHIAARPEPDDHRPLVNLLATSLGQPFVLRRASVAALTHIATLDALDALITLLPQLSGETRFDALEYLTLVTGQPLRDPVQWSTWWAENRVSFKFPWPLVRPKGRPTLAQAPGGGAPGGDATYYGLPIYARRVVFVLDVSTSMSGQRLATAQEELIAAVTRLADDVSFGIVLFGTEVIPWRPQLVVAHPQHKEAAVQFVRRIVAQGNTATYGGLQGALHYDAEAMYLLTDGAPTTGRIVEPTEIVAAITQQNRRHRQSIYTIGVGVDAAGSKFDTFLQSLAEENTGAYRRLEP